MIIAPWRIDARFGHKQTVVDSLTTWCRGIASQIGWKDKVRIGPGQSVRLNRQSNSTFFSKIWQSSMHLGTSLVRLLPTRSGASKSSHASCPARHGGRFFE